MCMRPSASSRIKAELFCFCANARSRSLMDSARHHTIFLSFSVVAMVSTPFLKEFPSHIASHTCLNSSIDGQNLLTAVPFEQTGKPKNLHAFTKCAFKFWCRFRLQSCKEVLEAMPYVAYPRTGFIASSDFASGSHFAEAHAKHPTPTPPLLFRPNWHHDCWANDTFSAGMSDVFKLGGNNGKTADQVFMPFQYLHSTQSVALQLAT